MNTERTPANIAATKYAQAGAGPIPTGSLADQAIYHTNFDNRVRHFENGYNAGILAGYNLGSLFNSHINWAVVTFPKQTSIGALKHLRREIKEVIADIKTGARREDKIEEYVDCLGCLLSSMSMEGITVEEIALFFEMKLNKNMHREWVYNGDGTYSHI